MIETVDSSSGHPVVRWQGLSLASLKYPEREAEKWVNQIDSAVLNQQHLIVLGLGCGYHIRELIKKYPNKNIYVIEVCSELIEFCEKNFSFETAQVRILNINSADELVTSARVQKAMSAPYAVIEHRPSIQTNRPLYKELRSILIGRDAAVFREHLKLRPQRAALFDSKRVLQELVSGSRFEGELVSIKDLSLWTTDSARWTKAGCLIQVLRELVK